MKFKNILFDHITLGMAIMFLVGLFFMFAVRASKAEDPDLTEGYQLRKYYKFNFRNFLIHFLGGLGSLLLIHDLGELVLPHLLGIINIDFNTENEGRFLYALAILAGGKGGTFMMWAFERFRKIENIKDRHIEHVHGPNCGHDLTPKKENLKSTNEKEYGHGNDQI